MRGEDAEERGLERECRCSSAGCWSMARGAGQAVQTQGRGRCRGILCARWGTCRAPRARCDALEGRCLSCAHRWRALLALWRAGGRHSEPGERTETRAPRQRLRLEKEENETVGCTQIDRLTFLYITPAGAPAGLPTFCVYADEVPRPDPLKKSNFDDPRSSDAVVLLASPVQDGGIVAGFARRHARGPRHQLALWSTPHCPTQACGRAQIALRAQQQQPSLLGQPTS